MKMYSLAVCQAAACGEAVAMHRGQSAEVNVVVITKVLVVCDWSSHDALLYRFKGKNDC